MKAGKWNTSTESYDPYTLPEGATLFEVDLDKIINCARCGQKRVYGVCYTSKQIHNRAGWGYAVCPKCYQKELREELSE